MRYLLIPSLVVLAITVLCQGNALLPGAAAQRPAAIPEVNPKVLAFLKPIPVGPEERELQKKLKERHNSAVTLLEERVKEYKNGTRDISFVFEAARLVAEAKLDLAETAAAKVEVLEQTLDVARLVEAHLQQQLDKGFGSKADLERARYARLSLEVDLLKTKQPGGAKPD
jgi:outer membrane protein TolC